MGITLDRRVLTDEIRRSSGFRSVTRQLEASAVRNAKSIAGTRVQRRTGLYEGSFEARFVPAATQASLGRLRLDNTAGYSEIIEKGSRPHRIRVRNARVLVNTDTGEFFGIEVSHPGTKPQNVIRDALLRTAQAGI